MFKGFVKLFIKNADDVSDVKVRDRYGVLASVTGIILNVILCAFKILVGFLTGNVSIVADGVNNLSDASSNVIGFFGFKMANRPADEGHPYGHGRYEYVSALIVAFLIMVIGAELLKSGIKAVITPNEIVFNKFVVITLAASIIVKLFMLFFNRYCGKKISSETLIATSQDSRNDVIATFAVLVAAIISYYTGFNLDGYMTTLVALFILVSGVVTVKQTLDPLLGKAPDKNEVEKIRRKIMSYEGVLGTHDLIVHDYGVGRQFASVHVEMAAESDVIKCHEIIDNIERDFLHNDNLHIVIHYDPISVTNEFANNLRVYLAHTVKEIAPPLTIHDLRVIDGENTKTALFDCVVPYSVNIPDEKVKSLIKERVKKDYPELILHITIDKNFAAVSDGEAER